MEGRPTMGVIEIKMIKKVVATNYCLREFLFPSLVGSMKRLNHGLVWVSCHVCFD
jgi:hypothetical protein